MADPRQFQGHSNPYGQMNNAYGQMLTPMELSQEKLDEKARKWQQLQAKVWNLRQSLLLPNVFGRVLLFILSVILTRLLIFDIQ